MQALTVFVMSWMFLFGAVGTGLLGPVRTAIEAEFGLSHSRFGQLYALVQLGVQLLFLVVVTPRLRHVSRGPVMLSGLLATAAGLACAAASRGAIGFYSGWGAIFIGFMVVGLTNNVAMDCYADNPRKGVVLLHAYNALGKVFGPLVTLGAGALLLTWRASYALVAGLYVLLACLAIAAFRRLPPPPKSPGAPSSTSSRPLFLRLEFWLCVVPFGLIAGGEAAFSSLLPMYFELEVGVSRAFSSVLLSIHMLGIVAGRFLTASLGTRISNHRIIGGLLLMGIFVFPAILSHQLWIYLPSLFLFGLMFSSTWPVFYDQAASRMPEETDLLAYGSSLGTSMGLAGCIAISSAIADHHMLLALLFGPCAVWLFGILYYGSRLSSRNPAK